MQDTLTRNELKAISMDFRTIASRFLRTDFREANDNLIRFMTYIDSCPVIHEYIACNLTTEYDIQEIRAKRGMHDPYPIPHTKEGEIAFTYQLLKYAMEEYPKEYWQVSFGYSFDNGIQSHVDAFHKNVVVPFIQHITAYLDILMTGNEVDSGSVAVTVTGGAVGQINIAKNSATLEASGMVIVNDIAGLNNLVERFIQSLNESSVDPDEKAEIIDVVDTMKEQVITLNPKRGLLKVCYDRLKTFGAQLVYGAELAVLTKDLIEMIGPHIK